MDYTSIFPYLHGRFSGYYMVIIWLMFAGLGFVNVNEWTSSVTVLEVLVSMCLKNES